MSWISFTLGGPDRFIFSSILPEISHNWGVQNFMYNKLIEIFDYPKFAKPSKETIKTNVKQIAKVNDAKGCSSKS